MLRLTVSKEGPCWNRSGGVGMGRTFQLDLEVQVVDVFLPALLQIWQEFGLVFDSSGSERLQCVRHDDPCADAGAEVLRVERAEWYHFPSLYVPCRPVVHQDQAEDILLRLCDRHGLPHFVGLAQERTQLKLKVQAPGWREDWFWDLRCRILYNLAVRSADRSAGDND